MPPSFHVSDHHSLENDSCILLRRTGAAAAAEMDAAAPQSSCSLEELNRHEEQQEEVEQPHLLPMDEDEVLPTMMMPWYYSWPAASHGIMDSTVLRNRHVRFGGIQSMVRIESVRDMTDEDLSDRWYSKAELLAFKHSARDLCKDEQRQLQQLLGSSGTHTPLPPLVDDETSSTRGMDVYFPSRQRHQAKYIWHVLQAFHHAHHVQQQQQQQQQQQHQIQQQQQCGITDPDYYVALLCEKWSAKVSLQAAERAMQDFYDAYFPSWRMLAASTTGGGGCRADSSCCISSTRPNHKRAAPY